MAAAVVPPPVPPPPWGRLQPLTPAIERVELVPVGPKATSPTEVNEYVFGRSKSCSVRVRHDRVSAQHCRIYCTARAPGQRLTVWLEDLGSANGTWVNRT